MTEVEELKQAHIREIEILEDKKSDNIIWLNRIDQADKKYEANRKELENKRHKNYHPKCDYIHEENYEDNYDCYYLDMLGRAYNATLTHRNMEMLAKNNNSFETLEDAQQQQRINEAVNRVNRRIDELNDGWVADFKISAHQSIICLKLSLCSYMIEMHRIKYSMCACVLNFINGTDSAEKIIKEFKSDLELIFGVKK
jgi:hypothetical protein